MNKTQQFILAIIALLMLSACMDQLHTIPPIPRPIKWLNRPNSFQIPHFTGKITIIGFYTEDCSGCVKIQPVLMKIMTKYGTKVQVIGVYTPLPGQRPTITGIKRYLKQSRVLYPIILDHNTEVLRAFRITSWPTIIVANDNQKILYYLHGSSRINDHLPIVLKKIVNQPTLVR